MPDSQKVVPISDVTQPVKPTITGVSFGLFIGGSLAFLILPIATQWASNFFLSDPADAMRAKVFYMDNLNAVVSVALGGAGGTLASTLMARAGKLVYGIRGGANAGVAPGQTQPTSQEPTNQGTGGPSSPPGQTQPALDLDEEPQADEEIPSPAPTVRLRASSLAKAVLKNSYA